MHTGQYCRSHRTAHVGGPRTLTRCHDLRAQYETATEVVLDNVQIFLKGDDPASPGGRRFAELCAFLHVFHVSNSNQL